MKNILKVSSTLLLLALMLTTGCKIKNPAENVVVTIKPDAVSAPFNYNFIDAKTGYTLTSLEGAEITIKGPAASYLYTADGYRTFKIVNGRIGVCLRKGFEPTASNPAIFDIFFNVAGFDSKVIHQELTSLMPTSQNISVINLNDLPKNMAKKDTTFAVTSAGLPAPLQISSGSTSSAPAAKFTIPAGTKFIDENNQPVTGNVVATVVQGSTSGGNTGNFMFEFGQGGFKDTTGAEISNKTFLPFNSAKLSFTNGGKQALPLTVLNLVFPIIENPADPNPPEPDNFMGGFPGTPGMPAGFGGGLGGGAGGGGGGGGLGMLGRLAGLAGLAGIGAAAGDYNFNNFSNGSTVTMGKATLNITGREYYNYYTYKVTYSASYGTDNFFNKEIAITPATDGYSIEGCSVDHSSINFTGKVTATPIGGGTPIEVLFTENSTVTLPLVKPQGFTSKYIAKFSVYCTDQKAYMQLSQGWKVYFIPRAVYDTTIVNGHKIQPADDQAGKYYLEVAASAPKAEKVGDEMVTFNVIEVPIRALLSNTEYIVCTEFGQKGLVFNNFNGTSASDRLVTPDLSIYADRDFVDGVRSMRLSCD